MSIRFAKRAAAQILNRGASVIRINPNSFSEAEKALTKEDIRRLISSGGIFAVKEKHNRTSKAKRLNQARAEGRRRGPGRRRGTRKARQGRTWEKKVRSQRRLLSMLKTMGRIDNKTFTRFYRLIKGNVYATKATLVSHLREEGAKITDQDVTQINDEVRKLYK
ncbi:MAG: 50S ribosomal protein L19e [Candidatus Micrarchaeota archaeon]|nr:50S ribosomal protein L19e [Candidatus Micrarchaeota archaeon]